MRRTGYFGGRFAGEFIADVAADTAALDHCEKRDVLIDVIYLDGLFRVVM